VFVTAAAYEILVGGRSPPMTPILMEGDGVHYIGDGVHYIGDGVHYIGDGVHYIGDGVHYIFIYMIKNILISVMFYTNYTLKSMQYNGVSSGCQRCSPCWYRGHLIC
jgi:hypothetical protein